MKYSEEIKSFINNTLRKDLCQNCSHEYLVKYRVDKDWFLKMIGHIREHGHYSKFYKMTIR